MRKKKSKAPKAPKAGGGKLKQLREAYTMTRRTDKLLPLYMALAFFGTMIALFFALGLIIHPIVAGLFGLFSGLMALLLVFGRRVQHAVYSEMDGQTGAAAAVLQNMKRGGWTVTPAVAVNKSQDVVHRAVGKPGIVLIAEGPYQRVAPLLDAERKRMNRFVADVPVHDIVVGHGEGEVELAKLTRYMMKLPKDRGISVVETNDRLRAVGDLMKNVPIPKGPMPKGVKMPKGVRPPR
ncbi:MAG: DUF4191 domain-containing protein [Sporichthyaceae bacterium]